MRWLYGILIVLGVLIGIAAFYPGSAPGICHAHDRGAGASAVATALTVSDIDGAACSSH
jgi:hypothetical protein